MSYLSRLFNHRNTQQPEKKKGFFSHRKADKRSSKAGFFQAKLSVNEPGDVHEKEADKAADNVVHRKEVDSIQRLSTPAEDEKLGTNDARIKKDKDIQEKPMEHPEKDKISKMDHKEEKKISKMDHMEGEKKEKDKMVQKKEEHGGSTASAMLSSMIETSAGQGTPLSQKLLTEMNSAFGVDFSCVRLHTDHEAAAICHELGAQAFTHGADIYFNEGKYDPESSAGKHLLSHELTHVIQQLGLSKQAPTHGK